MASDWEQNNYALIVDYSLDESSPRILLQTKNANVCAPFVSVKREDFWYSVERFNQLLSDKTGISVTTLRCLHNQEHPNTQSATNSFVMESHGTDISKHADLFRWYHLDEIRDLKFENTVTRDLIEKWLLWNNSDPEGRVPWSKPGWYEEVTQSLPELLDHLDRQAIGQVTQVRVWERSCILRVNTKAGNVFVKSVPHMFAHEPIISKWLHEHFPSIAPPVLAISNTKSKGHQMISPEYEGIGLDNIKTSSEWEAAIKAYTKFQIDVRQRVPELLALGCPERPLNKLISGAKTMFADAHTLQTCNLGLSDNELEQLRSLIPRLEEASHKLASYPIPITLDHGDLWSGQIIVMHQDESQHFAIYDWSDCSITHPFFSMPFFLDDAEEMLPEVTGIYTHLQNIYLEHWLEFESLQNLQEAFECAQLLGPLHNAVMYYDHILPGMEFRWEMEFMFMRHLRFLLRMAGQH